jgi:hypothetical protein
VPPPAEDGSVDDGNGDGDSFKLDGVMVGGGGAAGRSITSVQENDNEDEEDEDDEDVGGGAVVGANGRMMKKMET